MSFEEQIRAQPARLRVLVEAMEGADHPLRSSTARSLLAKPRLLLTGMGSSLFACYPAYLRLAGAGRNVALWETAELLHFARGAIDPETLIVAVSQSGETTEITALLEKLPPEQPVLAVTNVAKSALGRRATLALELGADRSQYPATQTHINSVALLLAVAHAATDQPLAGFLAAARGAAEALETTLADSFARSEINLDPQAHLIFLARGPSLASARQATLMVEEVAGGGAAALSAAEFRHGPIEIAGPALQAVVIEPHGPTAALVENLAAELERAGARVIRIADARLGRGDFRHPAVAEELAPVVNIAPAQALAYRAAVAAGRQPGVFLRAQSVTRVE
jgi:glucosamine--fructose-6-phosphate aminotransferase (isomerizing)